MPITSWYKETSTNADGSRHVVVRQYDQDGREYMYSFVAAVGDDVDAIITGKIAAQDDALAQSELESLVGSG